MDVVCHLLLTVIFVGQVRAVIFVAATNIMINKPSEQSSTRFSSDEYLASKANDGKKDSVSHTLREAVPTWQGDLRGYYVTSINVTRSPLKGQDFHLRKAYIGVSLYDRRCKGKVFTCGQWPDKDLEGHTITFTCPNTGPVRFVRIWSYSSYLAMSEVEVEGTLDSRLTGTLFDKSTLMKVTTPTMSLSAQSVTECGSMCNAIQKCLGFSYCDKETPNCLLATVFNVTKDVKWVSYIIQ